MSPDHFLSNIINPGLEHLAALDGPRVTTAAKRMLLAIAQQESGPHLQARYQNSPSKSPGPARGFWQFEEIGVAGVLQHSGSKHLAERLCASCVVIPSREAAWRAIEGHDILATGIARLLLLNDPAPLPDSESMAWHYYIRTWRPGKPHQSTWESHWSVADVTVRAESIG